MTEKEVKYESKEGDQYDFINSPVHYGGRNSKHEVLSAIQEWNLNFSLGSAVKYIVRAGKKPGQDELVDLRKAIVFLKREIEFVTEARVESKLKLKDVKI